jgi:O-antigen/teichoic acid export membrane protein
LRAPPPIRRALGRLAVSRYGRSISWLLASAVASRLATLVTTVVVSRVLAPQSFGRLAILQAAIAALAGLGGFGVGVALTKRIAELRAASPVLTGSYVGAGLLATVTGSVIVTGLYLAASQPVSSLLLRMPDSGPVIPLSAVALLCTALLTTTQGGLAGLENFRQVAMSQGAQSAVPSLGLILGAELSGLDGALGGYSAGTLVAAALSLDMLRRSLRARGIPIARRVHPGVWKPLLTLGFSAFAASLVVTSALLVGQLSLAHRTHGFAQVAVFNVSYRWQLGVMLLPATLAAVLLPTMARLGAEGRDVASRRLFYRNVRLTAVVSAVPAMALAALAPAVLGLSGHSYARHLGPLRILMLAAIPGALNNVLSSASMSLGAIRAWLLSDVVLAVAFCITAVLLIPAHGAAGLALAFLAGYVATDVVLVGPIARRLHHEPRAPLARP